LALLCERRRFARTSGADSFACAAAFVFLVGRGADDEGLPDFFDDLGFAMGAPFIGRHDTRGVQTLSEKPRATHDTLVGTRDGYRGGGAVRSVVLKVKKKNTVYWL
jgi:hypothetical protein